MATPLDMPPGSRYNIVVGSPHYPSVCVFDADDGISAAVIRGVDWESEVCSALARLYVPGTDVIDVGANLGLNSIGMHRRTPVTGTIHMFEPQHDVFTALRYNAQHVPAKLYNMAVADSVRLLCFEQVHGNVGGTPLQGAGGAVGSPFAFPISQKATHVLALPLDCLLPFPNRVSVIKIDAEGCELSVLLGAQALVAQHKPAIVIEVWPQNRPAVFDALDRMGYTMKEHIKDTFGDDFVWVPKPVLSKS
jgi:FkbM family methyltransferase